MFTAIIPTLQRAPQLWPLVDLLAEHPLVARVLVVNNAPAPLRWTNPKVRVLQQVENIFVNPAWNLGAKTAETEWLAIINDDVLFSPELLDYAAQLLRRPWVGIVGPAAGGGPEPHRPMSWRLASSPGVPFGTFMCMRRRDYVPIPSGFRIWGGDDWLFWTQHRPNVLIQNAPIQMTMNTTSRSPEFQRTWAAETEAYYSHWARFGVRRWWHPIALSLRRFRAFRGKWSTRLRREVRR